MTDRRSTLMAYPRPMTPPILGRAFLHELKHQISLEHQIWPMNPIPR